MTAELQTWDDARVTYDPEAKAWYVYLDGDVPLGTIFFSDEYRGCTVTVDRGIQDGRPIGIEILEG
jgi:uncharacterized protein YuzE